MRHVWAKYLEEAEHLRHVPKVRDTYKKRKETIERVFAEAKERHCLRYTNYRGLAKVKVQVAFLLPQFEKVGKEKAPKLYIFLLPSFLLTEIKAKSPSQIIPKRALSTV